MSEKSFAMAPSFLLPVFLLFSGSPPWEILLFTGAVLLHEAGHLAALGFYGCRLRGMTLSFSGLGIQTAEPYLPYKKEAKIFLAGPAAGLLACILTWLVLRWHFTRSGMLFFSFNLLLSLFNLVPIRGLDGGEALFALLCQYGEEDEARRISLGIHTLFLALLLGASLWLLLVEKNVSLLLLTLVFSTEKAKRKKATITS